MIGRGVGDVETVNEDSRAYGANKTSSRASCATTTSSQHVGKFILHSRTERNVYSRSCTCGQCERCGTESGCQPRWGDNRRESYRASESVETRQGSNCKICKCALRNIDCSWSNSPRIVSHLNIHCNRSRQSIVLTCRVAIRNIITEKRDKIIPCSSRRHAYGNGWACGPGSRASGSRRKTHSKTI